ncbi:conserved hypothetical protein [Desulfatibacillum aliphaticivorans]|uniref:DUF2188 domain-containing protein n=2 Tax=Desulfatibacillum aliphaticivorans TaxID=218208 RepID=B8FGY3_DESAL|nr:conserved hypothetical protein [Desulfatibacillum aliphaticivorans]
MNSKSQHIVKNPSGGWAVKRSGSSRVTKVYLNKKEAIERGRAIAKNQKSELYIHGVDGKVLEKDSYIMDAEK